MIYSHSEAASNLSDFFFRFHFHGLKSLPRAENLLFLSKGGVLAPEPKLFVRRAAPFCFFAVTREKQFRIITLHSRFPARATNTGARNPRSHTGDSRPTLVMSLLLANDTRLNSEILILGGGAEGERVLSASDI